jgi:c-di-GMP-binding flagellar brake protein YcgR
MNVEDIFLPGHKVLLSVTQAHFPLRFQPVVHLLEPRRMALNLPPKWSRFGMLEVGTQVHLSSQRDECIYGLTGEIESVAADELPSLWVRHDGQVQRVQRRTFYRLDYQAPLTIGRAVLPSEESLGPMAGTLLDVSAGGIGFTLDRELPPETLLEVPRLFEPLVLLPQPDSHLLDVRWCRDQREGGFRVGAAFRFADAAEQDRVARIVHQLQLIRLSRYCRPPNPI